MLEVNYIEYLYLASIISIMICINDEIIDERHGNILIVLIILIYTICENLSINSFLKCRKKLDY